MLGMAITHGLALAAIGAICMVASLFCRPQKAGDDYKAHRAMRDAGL